MDGTKKLFIQIHDATTPNAPPLDLVSLSPFANRRIDLALKPFESYETLRAGLLNRFGVPEQTPINMLPKDPQT